MSEPDRPAPSDVQRRAQLRRMKLWATGLLVLMAVVFVVAGLAQRQYPAAGYLRAFAEAAMVGALADWFAVTALFRRPLGLPIPHTAIIPTNKARIGQALGGFIAENFLTEQVLEDQLRRVEVARWGAQWLRRPESARVLASRIVALAPQILDAIPDRSVQDLIFAVVRTGARSMSLAPTLGAVLSAFWRDGRAQPLIDRAARQIEAYLADHQDLILEGVRLQSYRWLPKWVDRMIAGKIADAVLKLLSRMRDPADPMHRKVAAEIDAFIVRLTQDPALIAQGEALKAAVLADPLLRTHLDTIWRDFELGLRARLRDEPETLVEALQALVVRLGAWLEAEEQVQGQLNAIARGLVQQLVAPRRREIGGLIAQVVAGWSARRVVEKLELHVGPDLQYIRINGTIVGGLAGLAIYALARAFAL